MKGGNRGMRKVVFLLAEEIQKDETSTNSNTAATRATGVLAIAVHDTSILDTAA